MAEATVGPEGLELSEKEARDPRFQRAKAEGNGEAGRELLAHVAEGAELTESEERSALDWLLGSPSPIVHEIPVDFETPAGMRKLTFVVPRIDPRKIDAIELRNVNQQTGRVDRITADCEIVAEATSEVFDANRRVRLTSDEFLTVEMPGQGPRGETERVKLANAALALERRFVGQEGLLTIVAAEIRRLGGYDPQRLGTSKRRLVEASLG